MKTLLWMSAALMLVLTGCVAAAAGEDCGTPSRWVNPGRSAAQQQMDVIRARDPRPVLYYFKQPGCAPCALWARDFAPGTEAGRKLRQLYQVRDLDLSQNGKLVNQYQLTVVPTFLLGKIRVERYENTPTRVADFLAAIDPNGKPAPKQPDIPAGRIDQEVVSRLEAAAGRLERATLDADGHAGDLTAIRGQVERLLQLAGQSNHGPQLSALAREAESLRIRMDLFQSNLPAELRDSFAEFGPILKRIESKIAVGSPTAPAAAGLLHLWPQLVGHLGLTGALLAFGGSTGGLGFFVVGIITSIYRLIRRRPPPAAVSTGGEIDLSNVVARIEAMSQRLIQDAQHHGSSYVVTPQAATQSDAPELIPVAVRNLDLDLLHEAMGVVAKSQPHGAAVIEAIKSAAKQLKSKAPIIS